MFNLINLAAKAYQVARSFVSKPKFAPLAKVPRYIASWGQSAATISRGMAQNNRVTAENNARAIAYAAEQARIREIARQKELARQRKQAEVDKAKTKSLATARAAGGKALNWLKKAVNKYNVPQSNWQKLYTKDGKFKGHNTEGDGLVGFAANWLQQRIDPDVARARNEWKKWYNTSDETLVERTRREYADKARQHAKKAGKNKGGLLGVWENLNGEADRRRKRLAEDRLKHLSTEAMKKYKKTLDDTLKLQAKYNVEKNKKAFGSQAEYDAALNIQNQYNNKVRELQKLQGKIEGGQKGYSEQFNKNNTIGGAAGGWFNNTVVKPLSNAGMSLFNYTLGSGDKNIPSLTTAPSRAVNWIGNQLNKNRTVYKHDGKTQQLKKNTNLWQATFNQRNFNIKPHNTEKFDFEKAQKKYGSRIYAQERGIAVKLGRGGDVPSYRKWLKNKWNEGQNNQSFLNNSIEFAADPLLAAGAGAKLARKTASWIGGSKLIQNSSKVAKTSSWFSKKASDFKNQKQISWLRQEAKTPNQVVQDRIDEAKIVQDQAQTRILPRVEALHKKISGNKIDTSVFKEIEQLSDSEAKVLQRMVNGKLNRRDRIFLAGKGLKPVREKLENIGKRWDDFSEQMKLVDNVERTRFGRGKKLYSPRTAWITKKGKTLDEYNFKLKKKRLSAQSAKDFKQGAIDRYFKSSLDEGTPIAAAKVASQQKELKELLKRYDTEVGGSRQAVEDAFAKTQTKWGKTRNVATKLNPTNFWKKSVLKYRPAWAVNNVLYNTQANYLAGGVKGLSEQAKMINPRYFRKALNEVPENVKTNLAKEIGRGKVNKIHSNLENWSRVAAFRGAKKKGLTDEQALKRVDKYLFDYKTNNWERLPKSVLPFWAWSKNLSKAAVRMPGDRPGAAKAYNTIDRYQQGEYDKDFETMRTELKKSGYSDKEIDDFKKESEKYYKGRLKVGDTYITTPFNAFSERGLDSFGLNPLLQSFIESTTGKDKFGRKIDANDLDFIKRFVDKFPQASMAKKLKSSFDIKSGKLKPIKAWIGGAGAVGYGMTKEKQGYDPKKKNYSASLDPSAKLGQDVAAYFGFPRGMKLDKKNFLKNKKFAKIAQGYFATDWKKIEEQKGWDQMNKERDAFFKKFGVTASEFYEGVLSKNDTKHTAAIKQMKKQAAEKNKKLFEEYAKQPYGSRSIWAKNKLKQLNASDYFRANPFLKSFDWLDPTKIATAEKTEMYRTAKASGDWSAYHKRWGDGRKGGGLSQKAMDYRKAKASGDWSNYRRKWGTSLGNSANATFWRSYSAEKDPVKRRQMLRDNPQFAKRAVKSEAEIQEARFWSKYSAASKEGRRKLLADNPKYNRRKNWTKAQWDKAKLEAKNKERQTLLGWGNISSLVKSNKSSNQKQAAPVLERKKWNRRQPKAVWRI